MSDRPDRIVQLMPMSRPLWAVFAIDTPTDDGDYFIVDPVECLALVDTWESSRWPGAKGDEPPDRIIRPVTLQDGAYLSVDDAANLVALSADPYSVDARLNLNQTAREYVQQDQAKKAKVSAK